MINHIAEYTQNEVSDKYAKKCEIEERLNHLSNQKSALENEKINNLKSDGGNLTDKYILDRQGNIYLLFLNNYT